MFNGNNLKSKYLQSLLSNLSLVLFALLSKADPVFLAFFLLFEVFIAVGAGMLNSAKFLRKFNIFRFFSLFWIISLSLLILVFLLMRNPTMSVQNIIGILIFANWFYKTLKFDLSAKSIELGRPFLGFCLFVAGATFIQNLHSNNLLILWFFISLTAVSFILINVYKNKIEIPTII